MSQILDINPDRVRDGVYGLFDTSFKAAGIELDGASPEARADIARKTHIFLYNCVGTARNLRDPADDSIPRRLPRTTVRNHLNDYYERYPVAGPTAVRPGGRLDFSRNAYLAIQGDKAMENSKAFVEIALLGEICEQLTEEGRTVAADAASDLLAAYGASIDEIKPSTWQSAQPPESMVKRLPIDPADEF